jgi:serine protease Do
MKQFIRKRLLIAGVALLAVPFAVHAQNEDKENEKTKERTNQEMQQIIITRKGNKDDKTVIEINGDKVKINGKDVDETKDVTVNIHNMRMPNVRAYSRTMGPGNTFYWNENNNGMELFQEDEHRAMLGIVTDDNEKGAEIQSVNKGSGAEKAGLKKGDIITEMDNKKVEGPEDVTKIVHAHKPGDKINITVMRNGKEEKVTAELGKWKGIRMNTMVMPRVFNNEDVLVAPEAPATPYAPNMDFNFDMNGLSGNRPKLGLSIQDVEDGPGVKVLDVDDESAAEKAGIKEDDIIVGIDDHEIRSTDDVKRIIQEDREKGSYNFRIKRGDKTENVIVKIPRKLKTADL